MSTTAKEAPSMFSSLPDDILLSILARVPRRYHPILSCVSKNLRSLVCSSELHKIRSLLGNDCFYVGFGDYEKNSSTRHWFTLAENRRLVSVSFPSPPERYHAAPMVGPDIYFLGGYVRRFQSDDHSRSMWIIDSRSGKLRQGPNRLVASRCPAVGLVDDKIYIVGGECEEEYEAIQAQAFDLKTQTWQIAANPSVELQPTWMSVVSPSLDRKINARNGSGFFTIVYDPRDGNCERIELPSSERNSKDVCVIDNVLYVYDYSYPGIMWYGSKEKEWRAVHGSKLNEFCFYELTLAECNGKLAFLWREPLKMEIWCAMISLRRRGVVEVQGRVEWSNCLLSDVPLPYHIAHCFGRTDKMVCMEW